MNSISPAGTKDGVSACASTSKEDKQKLGRIAQKKSEQQLAKKRKTDLDTLTCSNSDPSAFSTDSSSTFNPIKSAFHKVDKASMHYVLPDSSMSMGCLSMQHAVYSTVLWYG